MSDIFTSESVSLTNLVTSVILFSTIVNVAVKAKALTLGILLSISVISESQSVF